MCLLNCNADAFDDFLSNPELTGKIAIPELQQQLEDAANKENLLDSDLYTKIDFVGLFCLLTD